MVSAKTLGQAYPRIVARDKEPDATSQSLNRQINKSPN